MTTSLTRRLTRERLTVPALGQLEHTHPGRLRHPPEGHQHQPGTSNTCLTAGSLRRIGGGFAYGANEKTMFSRVASTFSGPPMFWTTVIRAAPQSPKSSQPMVPMMPS